MAIGKEYIDKRLRKCKSTDYTKWQRQRFDDVDADVRRRLLILLRTHFAGAKGGEGNHANGDKYFA